MFVGVRELLGVGVVVGVALKLAVLVVEIVGETEALGVSEGEGEGSTQTADGPEPNKSNADVQTHVSASPEPNATKLGPHTHGAPPMEVEPVGHAWHLCTRGFEALLLVVLPEQTQGLGSRPAAAGGAGASAAGLSAGSIEVHEKQEKPGEELPTVGALKSPASQATQLAAPERTKEFVAKENASVWVGPWKPG